MLDRVEENLYKEKTDRITGLLDFVLIQYSEECNVSGTGSLSVLR
jgi:hypothetical protein